MNKIRLSIACLLLALAGGQAAADGVSVNPLTVRQGGTAYLEIVLESEAALYKTFQMDIDLPEGLSFVPQGSTSQPVTANSTRLDDISPAVSGNILTERHARLAVYSRTATPLAAGTGVLISVRVAAASGTALGTLTGGRVYDIEFSTVGNIATYFDEVAFQTDVTNILVLDENATDAPEEATGVNVRVQRTIKANMWNTICLPFAMTESQVKEAFGSDVLLGDFTSWSSEEDDNGDIVGLTLGFTSATGIEANRPYIIKVSSAVTEFSVEGVDVNASDKPVVQVGKKSSERGYFYGTYTVTNVPEEDLFLNGNKFWYSTGNSRVKGFRGYFELRDVLTAYYDDANSEVKVNMLLDDEQTAVGAIATDTGSGTVYDLQGRRMPNDKLPRGIYIVNGNKVLK